MRKETYFFALICFVCLSVFAGAGKIFAQDAEIKKGDTAEILGMEYVDVKNLEPIGNYSYGSACSVNSGDTISVIGTDGNRLLVAYNKKEASAYSCPNGVIFFVKREKFLQMKAKKERQIQKELAEKELIWRLLENK